MSAALGLYRAATAVIEPLVPLLLAARVRRGKEDPARLPERLGHALTVRPQGPLVWLHGASVGETLSLLELIARLRTARPDLNVLVTSGTTTSAELLARRLPPGAIHAYAPVDAPRAAARFLAHWRPDLAVFVESELWPNLIMQARAGGARLALLSARMAETSARGWRRAPGAARRLFSAFDLVMPQDDEAAARLTGLGARDDGRLNLKFIASPLPFDPAELTLLKAEIGGRPVLLAASTHAGEDEIVLSAFSQTPQALRPLLVLAPRHPARGADILELARAAGFEARLRSKGEAPTGAQVYVADTLGELGLWLRLARVAFIGGSLVSGVGGHNPLEPVRLGVPTLSGPHVASWRAAYDLLLGSGEVEIVCGTETLAGVFRQAVQAAAQRPANESSVLQREALAFESAMAKLLALAP